MTAAFMKVRFCFRKDTLPIGDLRLCLLPNKMPNKYNSSQMTATFFLICFASCCIGFVNVIVWHEIIVHYLKKNRPNEEGPQRHKGIVP